MKFDLFGSYLSTDELLEQTGIDLNYILGISPTKQDDVLNRYTTSFKRDTNKLNYKFTLSEDGTTQVYTQDLPGVKREDLVIEITDGVLLVMSTRDGKKSSIEVRPSKDFDVNSAKAKLDLGVLEIKFNKIEKAKKTIVVE